MKSRKTDFIVGFVISASIFILIFGIIYLKEYSIGKEVIVIYALFEDVGTLTEGDPVKINGVKMGKVTSRRLEGNKVLVAMEIDANVVIPDDSKVTIQNVGLMGERMIGIRMGSSPTAIDPSVPMKGYFDSGIAEAMGMLGDVFNDAKELVLLIRQLMDETIANKEFLQTFKTVTTRLNRLTMALDRMVAGNEATFNTILKDVKIATSELRIFLDNNKDNIESIVSNFSSSSERATQIVDKADRIADKVDALAEKVSSDEGTIGKILQDKELYRTLKSTIVEADSLLKTINKTGKLKVKIGF
jgi:phospholipid/cholesterol/gamma-HCH transport system substrate-binding protein